jgi:GNAT superfamily N-acetyltransferase
MIVREATRADLGSVVGLLHQDMIRERDETHVPAEAYAAAFDEITADPHHLLLVGELDGEVVATVQVTWVRHLSYVGGLMCQVESVRVRSDLRGRGLGRELMQHVIDLARTRGVARVELTTNARRVRAQEFYKGLGFVPSHVGMKLYLGEEHG